MLLVLLVFIFLSYDDLSACFGSALRLSLQAFFPAFHRCQLTEFHSSHMSVFTPGLVDYSFLQPAARTLRCLTLEALPPSAIPSFATLSGFSALRYLNLLDFYTMSSSELMSICELKTTPPASVTIALASSLRGGLTQDQCSALDNLPNIKLLWIVPNFQTDLLGRTLSRPEIAVFFRDRIRWIDLFDE